MPTIIAALQHSRFATPLLFGSMLVVLLADSQTQLGFAHGVLYTPIIVLAGLTQRRHVLHTISIMSVVSLWLGFLISPTAPIDFNMAYVLANRALATLAITLLWWLAQQTQRAQWQQQQQQSQEQLVKLDLTLASEVAGLSHWCLDDHRKLVSLDARCGELLAIPSNELTLEQFICCFDEREQPYIKQQILGCLETPQTIAIETRLHAEARAPIWIKLIAYPDPESHDILRGMLQNIELQHQKASLLVEQQQRFQQLADSLPVKVWTATADGTVDFASTTFAEFCGKDIRDIVQAWLDIIHPDDRPHTLNAWQTAVANKTTYKVEFRILRADGQYSWHLTTALPIFNDSGQVMYWFGSAMDISEQKALWMKTDRLQQSLYQTLENITDGFFSLDQHFRFMYCNQSAIALFQGGKTPAPGRLLSEVCYQAGKDFSPLISTIQRGFYKQKSEQITFMLPGTNQSLLFSIYPSEQGVSVLIQQHAATKMTAAVKH